MQGEFLFQGIGIGFSIAAPVGPIGVLCIRQTMAHGRAYGLVSGLGAATADALYGLVAGLGLTGISSFLDHHQSWLRLIGGIFLLYLGIRTFRSKPSERAADSSANGLVSAYVSTLALTLTNPATILSFIAVFAGLGLGGQSASYSSAFLMVAGVFFGSALWWLILSGGVGYLRNRCNVKSLAWVNRFSGVIIGVFGLLALASLRK